VDDDEIEEDTVMRNLVYGFNVSLDGYIEDKNGSIDWSDPSEELHRYWNDMEQTSDTHLYGRRLWETMGEYWPAAEKDTSLPDYIQEYAARWNAHEHVVVSTTLTNVPGARLIKIDVADQVRALKQAPGKNIDVGGATLAHSLMQEGLIDEIRTMVYPIVLGGGKPMFGGLAAPQRLRLVEVRHFNSGAVLLHYKKDDHAGA
jgi:dihydrofolate reductase